MSPFSYGVQDAQSQIHSSTVSALVASISVLYSYQFILLSHHQQGSSILSSDSNVCHTDLKIVFIYFIILLNFCGELPQIIYGTNWELDKLTDGWPTGDKIFQILIIFTWTITMASKLSSISHTPISSPPICLPLACNIILSKSKSWSSHPPALKPSAVPHCPEDNN